MNRWKSPHGRPFPEARCLIMGILNLTPDSFSDGGMFLDRAVERVGEMISEGADIIDVGAESTRPGAEKISEEEEWGRLSKPLELLRREFPEIPISVDTYKPRVACAAVNLGADMINDVVSSPEMFEVAAELQAPLVITHNSRERANFPEKFGNFGEFFMSEMELKISGALEAGVREENIILDPGIGFGKSAEMNFELLRNLGRYFGKPLLLGVSRKSCLRALVGEKVEDLDDATAAVSSIAAFGGNVQILRVHNVAKNVLAVKVAERIRDSREWTK